MKLDLTKYYSRSQILELFDNCIHCGHYQHIGMLSYINCEKCRYFIYLHRIKADEYKIVINYSINKMFHIVLDKGQGNKAALYDAAWIKIKEFPIDISSINLTEFKENIVDKYRLLQ